MPAEFEERRRSPRVHLRGAQPDLAVASSTAVQLVDVSESGVLFSSSRRLDPGQRAQLRTRIGVEPLTVQLEVRRVVNTSRGSSSGAVRFGAEFIDIDAESRRKLQRFLKTDM